MSKDAHGTEEIRVQAAVGGRRLTLDPIREFELKLPLREVESTIVCGFQMEWGEVDIDGQELRLTTGAGVGSRWATIHYLGKDYCFKAEDLIQAFLDALKAAESAES